jgi:hypothetical protein
MLQFILTLFGCSKAPAVVITSSELGPFTLEKITATGKRYDINYGRVNQTTISYNVKYKGEPLAFPDQLETNTGVPGIWRVFMLRERTEPTLILGSQSLYLVTLENEKPVIKALHEQHSDFASIQWLDCESGQPGEYREVYSSDEFDIETDLSGGRYMAISHAVVLDTRTLKIYPYNTDKNWINDYSINGWSALAFSPDSSQIIHIGHKSDEENYEIDHWALFSYNFKSGETYIVPFDGISYKMKDPSRITSEWIADYFEWTKQEDGSFKIHTKDLSTPPYQKGILLYRRHEGYVYILDPIKESITTNLSNFIRNELKLEPSDMYQQEGEYKNRVFVKYGDIKMTMVYGEYGNDLVLKQEGKINMSENKALISRIANGFNALLSEGKYQEEWMQ